jgi:thiosulfate/3-mercaptopyruvate sulfurtransferase
MKNLIKKLTMLATITSIAFALEVPANHIVDTSWLKQHIDDKNLVVIDTRKAEAYKKGHIKGAVNYPKKSYFQGKHGNIPKLPNTIGQMQTMLQNAGVTTNSTIIFYSAGKKNKDFADSASGIWNSWLYGIKNTALLNGGFAKWQYEKNSTTTKLPKITKSDLELDSYDKSIIASINDINEAIYDENIQITDARVSEFYVGKDKRKDLARHGRIPTAKLTPMIRYTKDTGKYFEFITNDEAKTTLYNNGYGVELNKPLIIYCNTGHKARGLWFVAKFLINMKNVKVYDDSIVSYSKTNMTMDTGESMD